MNTLNVPKITVDGEFAAADIPALLDKNHVGFNGIENVNWEEYPYKPSVRFRLAHTGTRILLQYEVSEDSIRAVAPHDNGKVWEDACVEFFAQPDEASGTYYNFECNCVGTLLIGYGKPGDREHASTEVLETVGRWSSIGREPFDEKPGPNHWTIALDIPASALFRNDIHTLDGVDMRANFYKCGDKLQTPHFLSWNKIDLPSPCFHCPPFFGKIHFE